MKDFCCWLFRALIITVILCVFFVFSLENSKSNLKRVNNSSKIEVPSLEKVDLLILVNRQVSLPSDYNITLTVFDGHEVAKVLINDLEKMVEDATNELVYLKINTAYRSIEEQQAIWDVSIEKFVNKGYLEKEAIFETRKTVLEPGFSEHHTGLAIDFSKPSHYLENKQMWDWLLENAHEYGFILRYPALKENITGISYEPWHYRYVGRENSMKIHELGLSLEEYLMLQD